MGIKLKHPIHLPAVERRQLEEITHKGVASARTIIRSRVLLMAHAGKTDRQIYEALALAVSTPYDIRKRYHTGGFSNALYDSPHPRRGKKLSVAEETKIVAIACTK